MLNHIRIMLFKDMQNIIPGKCLLPTPIHTHTTHALLDMMVQSQKNISSLHDQTRKLPVFCVVCRLVYPEKGPRGRLVCFCVVCPLVHPEKGPRGRLVCFCVVCVVCPLGTLKRVTGEGLSVSVQSVPWCTLRRVPGEGLSVSV